MKITFVLPFAGLSGGIKVAAIYARLLSRRGHDVTVVSLPRWKLGLTGKIRAFVRRKPLKDLRPPTPYLDFLGPRHIVLDKHRPVEERDVPDADVVIATWWETAEWVERLSPQKGRKFYLLQDYEVFPHLPADRVAATYTLPMTKIAVSNYIRDAIREKHGIDGIHIVQNGIDLEHFRTPTRERASVLSVGFMYQTAPRKNVDLALEVIRKARQEFPDQRVVAFGRIPPSAEHPMPDWVEYHVNPTQAQIPQIYASCDVWLLTSASEGFGLPILEAMACGTPVIATQAGAAPDLINGRNGVLVAPAAEDFTAALRRFHAMTQEEWRAYSDAAKDTARENTWETAVERLEKVLQDAP